MTSPIIVAIDGPSGAGKSTVARRLAERLGVPYIDTGAMYRAVGLAAREAGIQLPVGDAEKVVSIAESLVIELAPGSDGAARVLSNGRDVSDAIRTPEVSAYASAVSAIPGVRRRMVAQQRQLAERRGGVMEGRDIGTRVFPKTPFKFFLTAPSEVRAQRRFRELQERGTAQTYEKVLTEMRQRDRADETREDSPLTLDDSYVLVETTGKTADDVVDELEKRVRPVFDSGRPAQ
jgi:cytidylate kinase